MSFFDDDDDDDDIKIDIDNLFIVFKIGFYIKNCQINMADADIDHINLTVSSTRIEQCINDINDIEMKI